MWKKIWRAVIEVGFIIFLFYTNLLMGEYSGSGLGNRNGLVWALKDIFSVQNFCLANIAAFIGYVVVEWLRKKF